jgi:hypothetical protein
VADRLTTYANAAGRSISKSAAALITEGMAHPRSEAETELRDYRRQIEELKARLHDLQRQLAEHRERGADQAAARWEWPVSVLLEDASWWDRWLPRLHELFGRRSAHLPAIGHSLSSEVLLDTHGYHDLLGSLFPATGRGGETLTWRSPDYSSANGLGQDGLEARAQVWEPVIRHVAEALCLLERTGQADADPYLRLRAEAEITGTWLRVLGYLVGEEHPELPRQRLA